VERALLKQVQLNEAAIWSNPMAKAANISNSNSGSPTAIQGSPTKIDMIPIVHPRENQSERKTSPGSRRVIRKMRMRLKRRARGEGLPL
jgi:hypothetical protein